MSVGIEKLVEMTLFRRTYSKTGSRKRLSISHAYARIFWIQADTDNAGIVTIGNKDDTNDGIELKSGNYWEIAVPDGKVVDLYEYWFTLTSAGDALRVGYIEI